MLRDKKEPNVVVITQARTGSTRLPKKVMKLILGKPVLLHDIERMKSMRTINKVVVATTTLSEDDVIASLISKYDKSIGIYRGSVENVLDRYYKAAKEYDADVIVRITSDCPLMDPVQSDNVVRKFFKENLDYCTNNMPGWLPRGLDTEVFSFDALEKAWTGAKSDYQKEHVTPYFTDAMGLFKLGSILGEDKYKKFRWTLDYPEDLEFIREIYGRLYPIKKDFDMYDIIKVLEKEPQLIEINKRQVAD